MRLSRYILRRLGLLLLQVFGVTLVAFFSIRLLPGNPAYLLAGSLATDEAVQAIERELGLDRPMYEQYWLYLQRAARGDLGRSWLTSQPVANDLVDRFPATLELISIALVLGILIGMAVGVAAALNRTGLVSRAATAYGLLAGSIPEFWLGLILTFFLFFKLQLFPPPLGRLALDVSTPERITGLLLLDTAIKGNWEAFRSAAAQLGLPVLTLVLIIVGPIMKMTRAAMAEVLDSDYIQLARAAGLPQRVVARYALRNALPPVVTLVGVVYGYMIGGAVLVETIFSWGGIGQYVVQGIQNSDYNSIQGFLLVATSFSLLVYLAVDLLYLAIDPRVSYQ